MIDKKLSIVLVVFNKINFTMSALNDLFQLPQDSTQIIVVDNASSDETQQKLTAITNLNFTYIRNQENLMHSKACNMGFACSNSQYVMFLNNDIRVSKNYSGWTNDLLPYCDDAIVSPTMGLLDKDFKFVREANQELSGNSYLSGWCIVSSRENWKRLDVKNNGQIWDEDFPFYFNDTNLGFSCRKLGIKMKVVNIPVVHFGKVSASQVNVRKLYLDGRKVFLDKWR